MWWLRGAFQSAPWIRDIVATSRLQDLVKLWSLEANQDGLRISQSWQRSSHHAQDVRHSPFTASRLESKRCIFKHFKAFKKTWRRARRATLFRKICVSTVQQWIKCSVQWKQRWIQAPAGMRPFSSDRKELAGTAKSWGEREDGRNGTETEQRRSIKSTSMSLMKFLILLPHPTIRPSPHPIGMLANVSWQLLSWP